MLLELNVFTKIFNGFTKTVYGNIISFTGNSNRVSLLIHCPKLENKRLRLNLNSYEETMDYISKLQRKSND